MLKYLQIHIDLKHIEGLVQKYCDYLIIYNKLQ